MSVSNTLYERFLQIPDPRQPSGRRHSLAAILTLTVVAILSGARSLEAIAQFARDRGPRFTRLLGFTRPQGPCKATLSYLFRRLDASAVEAVISDWLRQRELADGEALALDGKTARGSRQDDLPGVHLLNAYAQKAGQAIAQMRVEAKTNEHKQALALLEVMPLERKVITGDAMFCQRDLSKKVLKKGGTICGRSRTISPSSRRRSPMPWPTSRMPRPRHVSTGSMRPSGSRPKALTKVTDGWNTAS